MEILESAEVGQTNFFNSNICHVMRREIEIRTIITQSTKQVQRENLDKENSTLKADLEQMQWLQEQYEQLQEKVLKIIFSTTPKSVCKGSRH